MGAQIDKVKVAQSFSRAAATYDSAAGLQKAVGKELLKRLDAVDGLLPQVMDLGCGTGYFSQALAERFGVDQLLCLDIAEGMLQHARNEGALDDASWLCADAESLPLKNDSLGLVFSSLALQWCENTTLLFSEIGRVLRPGGVACISTLGPKSLWELREAWQHVDEHVHVNRFIPVEDLCQALPQELVVESCETQLRILQYSKLRTLTDELKKIGAHNMNAGEAKGLTGREKVQQFKANYERFRSECGSLPASYEVYYLVLRKRDDAA